MFFLEFKGEDAKPIIINMSRVNYILRKENSTLLGFDHETVAAVKETPAKILNMIALQEQEGKEE